MLKDTQLHILADSDEHEAVQQVQVNLHFPKIIPKICSYLDMRGYSFPYSGRIFMQSVALYLFHLSIYTSECGFGWQIYGHCPAK